MKIYRRKFLSHLGLTAAGSVVGGLVSCNLTHPPSPSNDEVQAAMLTSFAAAAVNATPNNIRAQFELDPAYIHMAGLLLTSNPEPVRSAIAAHRTALDQNPALYVQEQFRTKNEQVRREAARYMGVQHNEIALTDSTTMGTGLAIMGLRIRADQEMLTNHYDYPTTHDAIRYQAERSGASYRMIQQYRDIHTVTADELVDTLVNEIRPNTRLVTATWVHSSTGLKVPIKQIAKRINDLNRNRDADNKIVFFVDGVHGFGVENTPVGDLGCDLFAAGTHKWMFGPRGTGVLWGHRWVHEHVTPVLPTFTNNVGWGGRMSPGGFKPFEHQWALSEAFQLHQEIGRATITRHIHALVSQLKEGLAQMNHVTLYTPLDDDLSSGIVCFDIAGLTQRQVVRALAERNIIASYTPYAISYARLTPGLYNTPEEVEVTLRAVRELVG